MAEFTDGPARDVACLRLEDMLEGLEASFAVRISEDDVDNFASLSGDYNPLHMSAEFARASGFKDRVVHGAFLAALVSRILGMQLPGKYCLLQTVQLKFSAPTYPGMLVRVVGLVDQISEAANAVVIKLTITNDIDNSVLASGKVQVGMTQGRRETP